jgi:hypothetical protein
METFFFAIRNGSVEELQDFLEEHPQVILMSDEDHLTGLHLAVDSNRLPMIKLLIDVGLDPNEKTLRSGLTPLHIAVRNKNLQAADLLLDGGANVNMKNRLDFTPLHISVTNNDIEMSRLLLLWSANPNIETSDRRKETPLIKAATLSLPMTRLLIESGAVLSHDGQELHVSLLANKPEISCFILDQMEKTIDKSRQDNQATVKTYSLKGNRIGRTHLQSLCSHVSNCDPSIAVRISEKLINIWKLDINNINQYGSVFHILVCRGVDAVSTALLDYLLSVRNVDCDQRLSSMKGTPLSLAIELGNLTFAMKLMKNGFASLSRIPIESIREVTAETAEFLKVLYSLGYKFDSLFIQHLLFKDDLDNQALKKEVFEWFGNRKTVLSLKSLVRIHLRCQYKRSTYDILKECKVPHQLVHYVLYGSCCQTKSHIENLID